MKTTLDLPTDLVREIKLRAVNEGRALKDVAADLLRAALAPRSGAYSATAVPKTLPVIKAKGISPVATANLTPQDMCDSLKLADLALDV